MSVECNLLLLLLEDEESEEEDVAESQNRAICRRLYVCLKILVVLLRSMIDLYVFVR